MKKITVRRAVKLDDEIAKKRDELNDLIIKRNTFVKYFGRKQEAQE